jgi:hypothetical protein
VKVRDDWKKLLIHAHSIHIAIGGVIFWGAISGIWVLWPAFVDQVPLWAYAAGGVLMSVALAVARVLKQPGVE